MASAPVGHTCSPLRKVLQTSVLEASLPLTGSGKQIGHCQGPGVSIWFITACGLLVLLSPPARSLPTPPTPVYRASAGPEGSLPGQLLRDPPGSGVHPVREVVILQHGFNFVSLWGMCVFL